MQNFDRRYSFAAGKAGETGFEVGGDNALHISFAFSHPGMYFFKK